MTGDSLRDDRDAIQAGIAALVDQLRDAKLAMDVYPDEREWWGIRVDDLSDELAALEAALDEADAAVARDDPELGPWGRDGL